MHVAFQGSKWIHAAICLLWQASAGTVRHLIASSGTWGIQIVQMLTRAIGMSTLWTVLVPRLVIHGKVDGGLICARSLRLNMSCRDNRKLAVQRGSYMIEQYFIVQRFRQELYRSCP